MLSTRLHNLILVFVLTGSLAACGGAPTGPDGGGSSDQPTASLNAEVAGGNAQTDTVGALLQEGLTVTATRGGEPVQGASVSWEMVFDSDAYEEDLYSAPLCGRMMNAGASTDPNGDAQANWKLGEDAYVTCHARAVVRDAGQADTVRFDATVVPANPVHVSDAMTQNGYRSTFQDLDAGQVLQITGPQDRLGHNGVMAMEVSGDIEAEKVVQRNLAHYWLFDFSDGTSVQFEGTYRGEVVVKGWIERGSDGAYDGCFTYPRFEGARDCPTPGNL